MPKRTGEQALRDDWKAANKAVEEAKHRLEAIKVTRTNVVKSYTEQEFNLKAATERRDRITAALEALIGKEIEDGESAAPATTGADEEVQLGSERKGDKS